MNVHIYLSLEKLDKVQVTTLNIENLSSFWSIVKESTGKFQIFPQWMDNR